MSTKKTLKRELGRLVIHVNDSIQGYQKAADRVRDADEELASHFEATASSRSAHVETLNSRLECIGEDSEERGSAEGSAHHALISLKDIFTSAENVQAVIDEANRGERKLLDYIEDTFDDVDAMDEATRQAIQGLRESVQANVDVLETKAKAA